MTPPSAPTATTSTAEWAGPRAIYLVTYGSGSCPRIPTQVKAVGQHDVRIDTAEHIAQGNVGCAGVLGPTTITVTLPHDTDTAGPLRIDVDGSVTTPESSIGPELGRKHGTTRANLGSHCRSARGLPRPTFVANQPMKVGAR